MWPNPQLPSDLVTFTLPQLPTVLNRHFKLDGIPIKIKWKIHALLHCISRFEGIFYKNVKDTETRSFISCCFMLAFTSADIIFHKFLEFHSILLEKRFLSQMFLF